MAKLQLDQAAQVAEVETEATLTLRDPFTGEKLEDENGAVTWTLIGGHTKTAKRIRRSLANSRMRKPGKHADDPIAAAEEESIEFLARITRRFANIEDPNGPVDYTPENVRRTLAIDWIRAQVDAFCAVPQNFGDSPLDRSRDSSSRTPSTTSASTSQPATTG